MRNRPSASVVVTVADGVVAGTGGTGGASSANAQSSTGYVFMADVKLAGGNYAILNRLVIYQENVPIVISCHNFRSSIS